MTGHRFHYEHAERLLDPKRKEWIDPQQAISMLSVKPNDTIVDLGSGNGYFTIPLAQATNGKVYAIDVQPEMIELLKQRAEKLAITNIEYRVADVASTALPSHSLDKGIMAFVFHEVERKEAAIDEIRRVMKPKGQFLLIEWEAIESEMGPPLHERIPSDELFSYVKQKAGNVELVRFHPAVYGLLIRWE
ncbi:class I SAM-dependent methyltransferase [Geobacillus stearothermophilus]|uniref:Type 11 methyltransferase n=1 Tax=Geobacillus kaustophilus GBlys TaxID=1337888 RepID=U2Y1W4_GEOKU|nr:MULTISPECIES: class I SAM-dependent methyltransferase [Geobacillus]MED4974219.1 class I SAM-dependent methyltransferase [Geobacillus thermoleovorans]MED3724155.1 class I SAM-dependent methyltransferase [Geobacillus stearothermophilus]MED3747179.1 class I SAM-dependent methyltransferase [Geobacillus stearothermophilus]MED3752961.1 class I SAM-dependent methyltransferase [Geobacillus stearothermophilus]MED3768340.1 class I SAM-dependent methyltransferase [Geobacillus stearothermophilus]